MKTITGSLIGLGIVGAVLFGLYGFLFWKVDDNNINTITINQEIYLQSQKQLSAIETKRSVSESAPLLKQASGFIVQADKVSNFLETIESFGPTTNTSVIVRGVSRLAPTSFVASSTEFLVVDVSSRGKFQDVYRFLKLVETLPNGVYIDSVYLSSGGFVGKAGSSTKKPEWSCDVSFRVASKKTLK